MVGTLVVVAVIATMVMPKTARGLVATLVQVANTSTNPVPTTQAPPVLITSAGPFNLVPDGSVTEQGPYDVSSYDAIRFYGDPFTRGTTIVHFQLISVDANGNRFQLDDLVSQAGSAVTGFYPMPGTSLIVRAIATCSTSSCSTIPVNFDIYGR